MLIKLYHYTTKAAYDEIIRSGRIMPSDPWTTMDASYGRGWYFTDLGPEYCDVCIAEHCWRTQNALVKVDHYLEFDAEQTGVGFLQKCRAYVYMIVRWVTTKLRHVGGGAKPRRRCNLHAHL